MEHDEAQVVAEERLTAADGSAELRYTEEIERSALLPGERLKPRARRICRLRHPEMKEPVSELELVSFEARLGETAIYAEGFAGVSTLPEHRGKGYIRLLFGKALESIRARSPLAFLYGIEKLYGKFGFVSSLPNTSMQLWIRRLPATPEPGHEVTAGDRADYRCVAPLFNTVHRCRPWTHVRDESTVEELSKETSWKAAPEMITVRRDGEPVGYALIPGTTFGTVWHKLTVHEAVAVDVPAARALLHTLARRCRELDLSEMNVNEPEDTTVGLVARALGCTVKRATTPDGGGMAVILDRAALVPQLIDELARRAEAGGLSTAGAAGRAPQPARGSTERLAERIVDCSVVPDDRDLIRLLLGFWSYDAVAELRGWKHESADDAQLLRAVFPGGGASYLGIPHAHGLDCY